MKTKHWLTCGIRNSLNKFATWMEVTEEAAPTTPDITLRTCNFIFCKSKANARNANEAKSCNGVSKTFYYMMQKQHFKENMLNILKLSYGIGLVVLIGITQLCGLYIVIVLPDMWIRRIVRFAFSINKLQYNVAYHQQRTRRRNIEAEAEAT
uniref:Uncharacterized protein n=1 Tax=Glossina pallidipes TaxID=7398 RepID=A0A1A9ZPG4_GLOPL